MSAHQLLREAERIVAVEYNSRLRDEQIENRHRRALRRRRVFIWTAALVVVFWAGGGAIVWAVLR